MPYYLIICRSLTYAQKTAFILEKVGVSAFIQRAPKSIAEEGCSHAVRVAQRNLTRALAALARADMPPTRVYLIQQDGEYREVVL